MIEYHCMSIEMVTISVEPKVKDKIISSYKKFQEENSGEYIIFFAKMIDLNVTIYRSKDEEKYRVFFSGKGALNEARKWDENAKLIEMKLRKEGSKAQWIDLALQIGSDEVGTGDFFGPITVVAALVTKDDITYLRNLGVDDSKRLDDEDILHIAPILIKRIPYAHLSLESDKFNKLVERGHNMNAIKAILHNKVLSTLVAKHPEVERIYVDQFCEPVKYFNYLEGTKQIVSNIIFKTKGESYYPSVACASIIARYSFLKKMDDMSNYYHTKFPFGAGSKVDEFAKAFLEEHGLEEFDKVVKKNFVNYKEIVGNK